MSEKFVTKIWRGSGLNVTGFVVPPEVVAALGSSRKPAVTVTVNGYTYRSTVATMGGKFMIGLSAEHRKGSGLTGDETVEVTLALDTQSRIPPLPADLKSALTKAKVLEAFQSAAPSKQKEFVRQVEEAKAAETRARRIAKVVASFQ
jgi:hypothetical protein